MKENKDSNDKNLMLVLYAGGAFFLWKLYERQMPKLIAAIEGHRVQFYLIFLVIALTLIGLAAAHIWNRYQDYKSKKEITASDETAVLLGKDERGEEVYLKQAFRTSHIQIIGTTNAGKTESFILPLIIKDIQNGSGLIIIDGKSDKAFLEKLHAYVTESNRQDDFRLFSLADVGCSSAFNPLEGGSPHEVVERVFSSFPFENEYYRNIQYKIFLALVTLIHERKVIPTIRLVNRLLTDMEQLRVWTQSSQDEDLKRTLTSFIEESPKERTEKISGLDAYLSHFNSKWHCARSTSAISNFRRCTFRFSLRRQAN
jgi:type IV secretory pathway TraG/TraD family ATPase VirD4